MSKLRLLFLQIADKLYVNGNGTKNILDIGYGNGDFLRHAENENYIVFGIDVNKNDYGIKNIDYNSQMNFDFICLFDSLEHLISFENIKRLKTKYYIVSIPNRPVSIGMFAYWKHYRPGEHLHYFSENSLKLALDAEIISKLCIEDIIRKDNFTNRKEFGTDNISTFLLKSNKYE
jgi:hypothetical protein